MTTVAIKHTLANDLADRILLVEPEVIDTRLPESEVNARRQAALPQALGAVLDLVAGVLRLLPTVNPPNLPRMADFARVLAALDEVTRWSTLATYRAKVADLGMSMIEGDTFARALYRLAPAADEPAWEGTSAEILTTLRGICLKHGMPASELPDDVRVIGRQVREIAPSLRKVGVDIRPGKRTGARRPLLIRRTGQNDQDVND